MRTCGSCGGELGIGGRRGRLPRFCSSPCRQRAYRSRLIPREMVAGSRWVRADGKRPIRTNGRPASSTDPSTWSTLTEVRASTAGDGFGIMLGDGLGCYDLDHVSDAQVQAFVATVTERILFVERSMSGQGAHVFIAAPEARGYRRGSVERYTRARFIRTTLERMSV